jgi:hypothetical protein
MLIYDAVSIHNKRATIMRDGYYKYYAKEVDKTAPYPNDVVIVYRPPEEVKKAHKRFLDLRRLPAIANHPASDLNIYDENSYLDGEGVLPNLRLENGTLLLDCQLKLKGKGKEFYDKGIKEISCGWSGEYEKVEGNKDYQYIQKFKDFNHIAILERGRCGNMCSIKDNAIMDEMITDGKKATIGETRTWQGKKYKKVAEGKWEEQVEKKDNLTSKDITINRLIEEAKEYKSADEFIKEQPYSILKRQIGDKFKKVEPFGNLWKSKGYNIFIEPIRQNTGFLEYLRKSNFVESAQDAGGGDGYLLVKVKPELDNKELKDIWNKANNKSKGVLDMEINELEKLVDDKIKENLAKIKDEEPKEEPNEEVEEEPTADDLENLDTEETTEESTSEELENVEVKDEAKEESFIKDNDPIAIYDKKIEDMKISIRDAFIENSKGTYEAVEMGIVKAKETEGKTPCEIKQMVVKRVLDKEVNINDMGIVNELFDVALKNYENPVWKKKQIIQDGAIDWRLKSKKEIEEACKLK